MSSISACSRRSAASRSRARASNAASIAGPDSSHRRSDSSRLYQYNFSLQNSSFTHSVLAVSKIKSIMVCGQSSILAPSQYQAVRRSFKFNSVLFLVTKRAAFMYLSADIVLPPKFTVSHASQSP